MIATYTNENGSSWVIHLQLLTMALKSSVRRIIGNSAFWTTFGREANLPIDLRIHAFQRNASADPRGIGQGCQGLTTISCSSNKCE